MRHTDDPSYVQKVPIPNVPFVRVPYSKNKFRTDSLSAISLEMAELVASIKQANTPEIEYMTDPLVKGVFTLRLLLFSTKILRLNIDYTITKKQRM